MSYLPVTLNHMRAVKAWADDMKAQVNLNVRDFNLEVKHRNRYYTLKPRFLVAKEGKMSYATALGSDVTGFVGWLPYDVFQWDLSADKLLFKQFLKKSDLLFPASWASIPEATGDFIIKGARGSFGYEIFGPYRPSNPELPLDSSGKNIELRDSDFVERFVNGVNLKVWFWGDRAFYAHLHPYPYIVGDGTSTARELVGVKLNEVGQVFSGQNDQRAITQCLRFQGLELSDRPALDRAVWMDFRYGRRYLTTAPTAKNDNDLEKISQRVKSQIDAIGRVLAEEAWRRFKAPLLYAVDGVVGNDGTVFWLEVNSNPILPPEGYREIFRSLFGSVEVQ